MSETDLDELSSNFGLRIHRSESWSTHANDSMSEEDFDSAFLFYWIAFNALYSDESSIDIDRSERALQREFIEKIHRCDTQHGYLYKFLWSEYSNSIRNLLSNEFIFGRYWADIKENPEESQWAEKMRSASHAALQSLKDEGSVTKLLSIVFDRLNVLRNQLAHGSSTYRGRLNRDQVKAGATFMHKVVPIFQLIFSENPTEDWGVPPYPPQNRDVRS